MSDRETMTPTMRTKIYVAIDIGCHECGVDSEPLGAFRSRAEAVEAVTRRIENTDCWRDGGLSTPEVFEMELP